MIDRVVSAFTEDQAARLAKISLNQLRYWDRTGFFKPSLGDDDRKLSFSRVYSFDDVVGMKTLGLLRNVHNVSLQHLRLVRDRLKLEQKFWAKSIVFVLKKNVYFENEIGGLTNGETGEDTLPNIPLPSVITSVQRDAQEMTERGDGAFGQTSKNRHVARNALVFKDTRIPIDLVKEYLADGYSVADILSEYPSLVCEDVEAAIRYFGMKAA